MRLEASFETLPRLEAGVAPQDEDALSPSCSYVPSQAPEAQHPGLSKNSEEESIR
jgi:hypothetical protein